jgi:hypothetical protein
MWSETINRSPQVLGGAGPARERVGGRARSAVDDGDSELHVRVISSNRAKRSRHPFAVAEDRADARADHTAAPDDQGTDGCTTLGVLRSSRTASLRNGRSSWGCSRRRTLLHG